MSADHGLLNARAFLDNALVGLQEIEAPAWRAPEVQAPIAAALEQVYLALAARKEAHRFGQALQRATEQTRAALLALQTHDTDDARAIAQIGLVAQALGSLLETQGAPLNAGLDLPDDAGVVEESGVGVRHSASVDEPRTLILPRAVLAPAIALVRPVVPPPALTSLPDAILEPDPAPFDDSPDALEQLLAASGDLDDEPAAAVASATTLPDATATVAAAEREELGEPAQQQDVVMERAQAFFEDLSMMGLMRRPDPGDLWRELRPLEDRLLARLDAIVACGLQVLPALVKSLEQRPLPDPELTWGAIFLYGSLSGDDALDQVFRLVRTAPLEDDDIFDAVADVLFFVPHPGLPARLGLWLKADEPRRVALALRVLGRRTLLSVAELAPHARHPDLTIAREAARALAAVPGAVDAALLAHLLAHEDPAMVQAGLEAGLRRREPGSFQRLYELVSGRTGEFAQAAVYLGAVGDEQALEAFRRDLGRGTSDALMAGIGRYGSTQLIEDLLQVLADTKDPSVVAALQTITGASLTDDFPEPSYEQDELPFVRPFRAPEAELELSRDAEVWRAWWRRWGTPADPRRRYRHGHLWSRQDLMWELRDAPASPFDRRLAHLELVVRTRAELPFDPETFVVRQQRQIAAWEQLLHAHGEGQDAGTWFQTRGRRR